VIYSLESEQAVIGSIFLDANAWHKVSEKITADDFFEQRHQLIFKTVSDLVSDDQPYDIVTVAEHLEKRGELDRAGGMKYLASLIENTPSAHNVSAYTGIVKSRKKLRELSEACNATLELINNPQGKKADQILAEIKTTIDNIEANSSKPEYDWIRVLTEADQSIEEAKQKKESGSPIGVPTGIPCLDDRIGGYPDGKFIIIAARPSVGKTAFVQQSILHAASRGFPVGLCSLEMTAGELGIRSYANQLGVNGTALSFGDKHTIEQYTQKIHNHPMTKYKIWVDADTYDLGSIIARAHEWKHQHDIKLFIVDHIGLVEGAEGERRDQKLGSITRALKKLSKKLFIPIIGVCQLNRAVEKEKRRPQLQDLRDSGCIEQDCDVALFLYSDDEDSKVGTVRVEIGALKTRYGRKGWLPQAIEFDGRNQRFKEAYCSPVLSNSN